MAKENSNTQQHDLLSKALLAGLAFSAGILISAVAQRRVKVMDVVDATSSTALAVTRSPSFRMFELDQQRQIDEAKARSGRRAVRVLLIRHAQSMANTEPHLISGRSNHSKLSPMGRKQAEALGQRLKREGLIPDKVYSSTAVRARDTAYMACEIIGIPKEEITCVDDILELGQGGAEGKLRNDVYNPEMQKIIDVNQWEYKHEGIAASDGTPAESLRDVETRVLNFVETRVLPANAEGKKKKRNGDGDGARGDNDDDMPVIALFMHGLAIKCFLRAIQASSVAGACKNEIENTAITELEYRPKAGMMFGWKVKQVNDYNHIRDIQ